MEEEGERSDESEKREIGKLAVWSVSSAKPGNGVDLLRDSNIETYWQSDGAQPHLVNIQFQKKVRLQQLAIYVDYKHDESYTPNKISVRAGNSFHDLREIKQIDLTEPVGWVRVTLSPSDSTEFLRAFLVQLAVLSNHQNGRDTHIRQIKIYGPRQYLCAHALALGVAYRNFHWFYTCGRRPVIGQQFEFTSTEFIMYSTVR